MIWMWVALCIFGAFVLGYIAAQATPIEPIDIVWSWYRLNIRHRASIGYYREVLQYLGINLSIIVPGEAHTVVALLTTVAGIVVHRVRKTGQA